MLFNHVIIEAVAYVLPDWRVTSTELEDSIAATLRRLNMPSGVLEALSGIAERRFWEPGTMPSTVATAAARKLLAETGVDPQAIGCLINASVSKDYLEPSVAALVHGNLGLAPHCLNYDIGNACLGFLNAMVTVGMLIDAGQIEYGLVVAGEGSQDVVAATLQRLQAPAATSQDFRDNFAALTLGSGAVAMLLAHESVARSQHRLNGMVTLAASEHNRLCFGQPDYMTTDAPALLNAGVALAARTWQRAAAALPAWADATIDVYTPHQVSARNTQALAATLNITPAKLHLNYMHLGNIGPAALPITLTQAAEAGRLAHGSHVALLGIGSGLNCAMMSVTW